MLGRWLRAHLRGYVGAGLDSQKGPDGRTGLDLGVIRKFCALATDEFIVQKRAIRALVIKQFIASSAAENDRMLVGKHGVRRYQDLTGAAAFTFGRAGSNVILALANNEQLSFRPPGKGNQYAGDFAGIRPPAFADWFGIG